MVGRSLDALAGRSPYNWLDNDASALVRHVNYILHVTLTRGAYGGMHELELSCAAYGRPVLHIENEHPDKWTLAVQDQGGRRHVLTGQIGWQPSPRSADGTNPIFNSDNIRDLRALWVDLAPRDSADREIPFPDLRPIIEEDGTSLTYEEASASCDDVDQAIRTVTDRLRYVHEQLLLHCIQKKNAITCYNIGQSHWQRANLVRYTGQPVS